jgi:4-amino-4-deoxy-L-arabinose transferase-like glycosyltransferase
MDAELTLGPAAVETSAAAARDVKKVLTLALVTCAAARLCLVWRYYCMSSDGVIYIDAAKNFFAGNISAGFGSIYPPGYPLLIAGVFGFVRDWELAGQLVSVAFGVGLLVPLFLLLRDMFDERVAGVACLLASLSPFLARYSAHVRSESPYLFFTTLALWLLAQGMDQNRPGRFFGGALVAGFAYLVRPEAVGLLVLIPGLLAFRRMALGQPDWTIVGKYTALLATGFLLFALPYIVYLSIGSGEWGALSRKAGITLAINLEKAGIVDIDKAVASGDFESLDFFHLIRRHPLQYAAKVVTDLPLAVGAYFEILYFSYAPFLLIGLFFAFRGQFWRRREFLLLGFVLFYLLGLTMILVRRRYSLQLVPVSLGWCAIGVLWVWQYCRTSLGPRASPIALASIAAFFLAATLPKTLSAISPEKAYVREAGRYLGKLNQDGALKVAVLDERITYYAGAQTLSLFGVRETGLEKYLRDRKADFLAAEIKLWQRHFPMAARRPEEVGLSLDREFVGTRKDRLLVFKVN